MFAPFSKLRQVTSNDKETDACRQFFLQTDINQARVGILLVALPLVSFIVNDYQFLGLSWAFYGTAALRFGFVLCSAYEFVHIGKVKNYRSYDKTVTLGSLAIMIGGAFINATRPQNFITQVIVASIFIFIVYIIIPNRFLYKIFLALTITVGESLILILFLQTTDMPALFTVFSGLIFTNLIAIISAWQLHTYRSRSYQDYVKRKELQETLEQHSKHLEELVMERTEKLKNVERLAAIGATAGMVGHDIRNPLTAITGAVYLAKKETRQLPEGPVKEKLQKNLEFIGDQTLYVNKIVEDLQDYARPLNPNFEEVDLQQTMQSTLSVLKIPATVTVAYQTETVPKLKTDAAYLKRILTNLINNAVQAMPQGGKLTIMATAENGGVGLSVEDTGEGIAEETKLRLFTPLVTTKSKGQGFGLAVVKRLTEALGGTVRFDSELGKGTRFTVELPQ
jgi:signal transduction histidine kinase